MIFPVNHQQQLNGSNSLLGQVVQSDEHAIELALLQAKQAELRGEVPVGALVVQDKCVVSASHNAPIDLCDPTAHAEVQVLRQAAQILANYRLSGCTLYVTLEPCVMCVGALLHARIARLVFGAYDHRAGAVVSCSSLENLNFLHHKVQWQGGVAAHSCSRLLKDFFQAKR
jgi:tRNA(adenine34) deaminase